MYLYVRIHYHFILVFDRSYILKHILATVWIPSVIICTYMYIYIFRESRLPTIHGKFNYSWRCGFLTDDSL